MRQWTPYTCAPTVLRICAKAFTGITITCREASALCKTTKDGTEWHHLKRAFKRANLRIIEIKKSSVREWAEWLELGYFIVAADDLTYTAPHVITVSKNNRSTFTVLDPVIGLPTTRDKQYVVRSSKRTAFAVCAL